MRLRDFNRNKMPFPLLNLLRLKYATDLLPKVLGPIQSDRTPFGATTLPNPLGEVGSNRTIPGVSPLENPIQPVSRKDTLGRVPGVASTAPNGDIFGNMFTGVTDDEIQRRIGQARSNLGAATLSGLLGTLLQSSRVDIPQRDDTYLDRMVRKTPQYLVDSQNAEVDRTTRGAISNVLASAPINQASNAVNAIVASGVEGKNRLAEARAQQDIGLENQFLGQKQQSLNQYNANVAQAKNMTTDSENTRIGNVAALGTNYFNQIQDSINNMNALKDRNEIMRSQERMAQDQIRMLMGGPLQNVLRQRYSGIGATQPTITDDPSAKTVQSNALPPGAVPAFTPPAQSPPPAPTLKPALGNADIKPSASNKLYDDYIGVLDKQYQSMGADNKDAYDNSWKYRPKDIDRGYDELVAKDPKMAERKDGAMLTEAGYRAIDNFEFTKGTSSGKSMKGLRDQSGNIIKEGYSRSQEGEIKKFVEENIGMDVWNKMPEKLQTQIYSFAFNSVKDARILRGLAQALAPDKIKTDKDRQNLSVDEAKKIIKEAFK